MSSLPQEQRTRLRSIGVGMIAGTESISERTKKTYRQIRLDATLADQMELTVSVTFGIQNVSYDIEQSCRIRGTPDRLS